MKKRFLSLLLALLLLLTLTGCGAVRTEPWPVESEPVSGESASGEAVAYVPLDDGRTMWNGWNIWRSLWGMPWPCRRGTGTGPRWTDSP